MLTKKVKISILLLIWGIVIIQSIINNQEHEKNLKTKSSQAVTAFSVIEDQVIKESITGYGKFGNMKISEELREQMLRNLAEQYGITDGYTFSAQEEKDMEKIILTKEGKYATTILQTVTWNRDEKNPEQYIAMSIMTEEGIEDAYGVYEKMKRIYKEIGVDASINMEVELQKQGDYTRNTSQRKRFISEIMQVVKGKLVDDVHTEDFNTVYGYTPKVESYLTLNGQKTNLQIAMSYNEQRDITSIKLGIPILNTAY